MVVVGLAFWALLFGLSFRVLKYFQSVEVIGDLLAHHLLGMILMVFFSLLISAISSRLCLTSICHRTWSSAMPPPRLSNKCFSAARFTR